MRLFLRSFLTAIVLAGLATGAPLMAQDAPAANPAPAEAETSSEGAPLNLEQQQLQIQRDYERFEQKLLELGEVMRPSDPDRAELLTRTRSQSRELRILDQMRSIAQLLNEGNELGDAVVRQEDLLAQMATLLKLLQSEDARDRLQKLIEAYQGDLKDLNKIIGDQKDARAATERGGENQSLQNGQQRVNDKAHELADKIDRRDAERAAEDRAPEAESNDDDDPREPGDNQNSEDQQSPDGKPSGKPSESQKPGENKPQEPGDDPESKPEDSSQNPDSKPMPGEPQSGSPSKPQPGSPSQPQPGSPSQQPQQPGDQSQSPGQQPQQQPGEQQEQDSKQQTPGRQDLEQALENMQKAIEELKQQKRDGASDEQDAALAHLEQMKAKLEEILRQLREEEREMLLTQLEARFQEMLRIQLQINAETERLDKVPSADRESRHAARATELARTQRDNALDADRALILLKEEGSSVAFPEAVEQMRNSMNLVASRLDHTDTGETTRLIEQIIVETLDEMILALQRELEKMKQQEQQQQQQQQQQPQDQALVDAIAELKMIRSLQNQVNRMTRQVGLEVEGEQAVDEENLKLLGDLKRRQRRIQEATYDLSTGKSSLGQELRKRSQQQ
jgi:hypothetical protein